MTPPNNIPDNMDALLVAYADGELDETAAAAVEAYLADNPAAQRLLAIHRETAALLRSAFPESLYADAPVPASLAVPRRTAWPAYGWAVAASILMGIAGFAGGAAWHRLAPSAESDLDHLLTEVAEYHAVYSKETVHLVEVPASQSDHLKAWLGARVQRPLVIPDFRQAGLTFAGGRLVVLDGAPVAELMYTREHGLPIAFCIVQRPGSPGPVAVESRGALNLATWDDGSHAYIVVGEAVQDTISTLADLARKQL